MQTWAKRGIKTALLTGGLLMLGTGIASADEDVNPDRPASPLDGSITVPVHAANNAIGTPFGRYDLPAYDRELTLSPTMVTGAGLPALPALPGARTADATSVAPVTDDTFRDNRVNADLVLPVDVSGNAIAVLGEAEVTNDSTQVASHHRDVTTDGSDSELAGNAVDADWALPLQVTGNAVSAVGEAETHNTASQTAASTGDLTADGSDGTFAGNLFAPQFATPVQVNGNAIAGAGNSTTDSETSSAATAGGTLLTDGEFGTVAGNAVGAPLALPVELNGNALGAGGDAVAATDNTAEATAGAQHTDVFDHPAYIESNGHEGVLSGNAAQPASANPVLVSGNVAHGLGNAETSGGSNSTTVAGGNTRSWGQDAFASGTIAQAPLAAPAEVFSNVVTGAGDGISTYDNTVAATAGGDAYTRGHDGAASGSVVTSPVSAPVDVFGNAAAGAGAATTDLRNDSTTGTGGATGTTGDDSVAGGNAVFAPVALPLETLGNTAGGVGSADTSVDEVKVAEAGDDGNTVDDAGFLAANLVQGAVGGPVQVAGNSAGAIADTSAHGDRDTRVGSGGDVLANGDGGAGAGNIANVPVAMPAQVFDNGVTGVGNGEADGNFDTTSRVGGTSRTSGRNGFLTGNVAGVPVASAVQGFGNSVAAAGVNNAGAEAVTTPTAGGTTQSNGDGGTLAGNVVGSHALPLAQGFGSAVSGLGGENVTQTTNETTGTSGGDITTSGNDGFGNGNLVDVPLAALAQPHGDAVAALGSVSTANSDSTTDGAAGGTSTTEGDDFASGTDLTVPVGVNAPIYDVPAEILAEAVANATNATDLTVGEEGPQLDLPISDPSLALPVTSMPRIMPTAMPSGAGRRAFGPQTASARSLPGLPGLPTALPALPGLPVDGLALPAFPGLPTDLPVALPTTPPALPDRSADLPVALPAFPGLPAGLPVALPTDLPTTLPAAPGVPTDLPTDLPVALPTDLPTNLPALPGLPADLPFIGDLELPVGGEGIGGLGGLDGIGALPGLAGGLPAVPALPTGPADLPRTLPAPTLPGDLPLPGLPTGLPGLDGLPAFDGLPGLGDLPVDGTALPALPAVPGVAGAQLPVLNHPVHTLPATAPAMSGLDTDGMFVPASLADTTAKLRSLFG